MLKISEFSKLTYIPVKTLRYYDEIGLFSPAQVDKFTGYRYYSMTQLPRFYRLMALKELGFSLEQIKHLLDENINLEQLRGMLRLRQSEMHQQLKAHQRQLQYVENTLKLIELEGNMSNYDIILKSVPAFRAVLVMGITPTWDELGITLDAMFDKVAEAIQTSSAKMSDNPAECGVTIYHDKEYKNTDIELEAAMGVIGDLTPTNGAIVKMMPAVEQVASVIHHGEFATMRNAYDAVMRWIDANGYEICGGNREINLEYERGGDQSKYVTEIQVPVKKKG
ncbi:MAG TPA: MerR family transcriptional regulator [Aggregatilineales bacterium]|nr:MerR family transcriptional regulator [Aggregatilineales bacterium]